MSRGMNGNRFRRRGASVEELQGHIGSLVTRRQALRENGGTPKALERNRRQLARCQRQLSFALIDRYLPEAEAA